MRKLAILTFQTLDGVMQAPSDPAEDSSGGFEYGGWAKACWDEVMEQVSQKAMNQTYDLLLGRNTYDIFASSFASADQTHPLVRQLNQAKKYVVTSTPESCSWMNTEIIGADFIPAIKQLKQDTGPLLQVHGSWQLIQSLLDHQLIDEFRIWTFPVILGRGKQLFSQGRRPADLILTQSQSCTCGAVMTFYELNND